MYINEFKNTEIAKNLLDKIHKNLDKQGLEKRINIMEVCGTHTRAIYKSGIDKLLPKDINLISGPGCPICVTESNYIDDAVILSKNKNVILCTFADMLKVPGSINCLSDEKSEGANIKVVYSPLDCINIAKKNKEKEVVFIGVGFETTTPIIALTIKKAYENNIKNLSVLHSLKTMPNAIKNLILDKEVNIDGFICPGHVSTVIGIDDFDKLARRNKVPMVLSGFEYVDIIYSIYRLCEMIKAKEYKCENQYKRVVRNRGNELSKKIINEVFKPSCSNWRGLGMIENTGLQFREKYMEFDAKYKFKLWFSNFRYGNVKTDCICGEILRGIKNPNECKLFKNICTPQKPIGPCMVSEEGACANFYKYKEG